jgi:hypothetical protein
VSYGVTDSTQAVALHDMLRIADANLFRAKREGRNRVIADVDVHSAPGTELAAGDRTSSRCPTTSTQPPRGCRTRSEQWPPRDELRDDGHPSAGVITLVQRYFTGGRRAGPARRPFVQ